MTTLYRLSILACLITIAYAVWKIAHTERVTSVTPDVPKSDYVSEQERQFEERQLKRAEEARNTFQERQANRRLGVK